MDKQQAIERVAQYVRARTEKPIFQLDDTIHGVHVGTQWEGVLRLSDLRVLLEALRPEARDTVAIPLELARRLNKVCLQSCPWSNLAAEAGDELAELLPQNGW